MFLLLLFGIINLQVLRYRDLKELSNKNCIRLVPQAGARGRILDTEGDIIISSKLSYDVMILPQDTRELERVLIKVSRILGVPFDELKQTCKSEYIASSVPIAIARNIYIKKAIALEEIKTTLPGIIIQPQPLRNYPYRKL